MSEISSTVYEAGPSRQGDRGIVKRRRTVKACDCCRSVRSRCQRSASDSAQCIRCERLSAECKTTQPSRFSTFSNSSSLVTSLNHVKTRYRYQPDQGDPQYEHSSNGTLAHKPESNLAENIEQGSDSSKPAPHTSISLSAHLATEPRILGYTSLSSLRDEISDSYGRQDERSVGNGVDQGDEQGHTVNMRKGKYRGTGSGLRRDMEIAERGLSLSITENLLSDYATYISPLNPILLSQEIFSPARMGVVTIAAVCAVASLSRTVPTSVFLAAKSRLMDLLDQSDVLKVASVANIQALLIATSKAELLMNERQSSGGSLSFQRCSSAIRMAQELGLHRTDIEFPPDINTRRRSAWRSCLIADRWLAAGYGLPQIIDLDDCDDVPPVIETDRQMILQAELFKVSALLGRVLKEIYTPKILARTYNDRIEGLIMAIDHCRAEVNHILHFTPESEVGSVVFELSILTVEALFLRGITSTKIQLPSHITYRPSPGRWKTISQRSQSLVAWMEERGDWLLDTSRIGLYGLTFCSLMMFRDYSQTRSPGALTGLRLASKATSGWAEGNGETTCMTNGRKNHAHIIKTLYIVARDGVRGRGLGQAMGERLHVVSPLAEEKKNRFTTNAVFQTSPTSETGYHIPAVHLTDPQVESPVQKTELLQLDREVVPIPAITTNQTFDFDTHFDPVNEDVTWSLPLIDNWLSEILNGETSGAGWTL